MPKVPISDAGTATAGISVALARRRNTKTTRITNAIEISSERSTSCTEARSVGVRSETTVRSMAAGIEALSWGSSVRTLSTACRMLASGCLNTCSSTAGLPFMTP